MIKNKKKQKETKRLAPGEYSFKHEGKKFLLHLCALGWTAELEIEDGSLEKIYTYTDYIQGKETILSICRDYCHNLS
jgi:hypothetical protein